MLATSNLGQTVKNTGLGQRLHQAEHTSEENQCFPVDHVEHFVNRLDIFSAIDSEQGQRTTDNRSARGNNSYR